MADDAAFADEARARRFVLLGGAILLFTVIMAVLAVFRFAAQEERQTLLTWQDTLGIVADSRASAVDNWVGQQVDVVRGLAENTSLQLYMTTLDGPANPSSDQQADRAAEVGYLRNYLVDTAARTGFAVPQPPGVDANVTLVGRAGLALTDADGNILVATPAMPPLTPPLVDGITRARAGQPAIVDLHEGPGGDPSMGFVMPVYALQDDPGSSRAIGFVVGLRPVADALYAHLAQPGDVLKTAETYLVRRRDGVVDYLSPLADGKPPLGRKLAADTPELAAAYVLDQPGGFATKRDYGGTQVLVTGRALATVPWVLVRKVDVDEAMSAADRRRQMILISLILVIVLVAGIILLVWRHGTSVRAARAAARFRQEAERYADLSRFLEIVTDSQPTAIAAIDAEGRYTFANRGAAETAGLDKPDLVGKTLAGVHGPVRAKVLETINRRVRVDRQPVTETLTFEDDGASRIVRSNHVPLAADGMADGGVLMTLEDITDLMVERQRREATLRDLVRTLVGLVDRRDPYSANQSARVAEVAVAIASEMEQSDDVVRTVDIAGNLMNLGKILVPPEVLTKTGGLTDSERALIRDSILASADLVETVPFDLPVAETLRQMQEQWDGNGYPSGLAGESIAVSARIIAVANAFVGMVSARAYRDAMPLSEAGAVLMTEADSRFDRRPVSALLNYIENKGGRDRWRHFAEAPEIEQ